MDGRKNARIDNLSKLTKIEEVRERLAEEFEAEPSRQRLFYRGKQVGFLYTCLCAEVSNAGAGAVQRGRWH